jgi:hypothetical protein
MCGFGEELTIDSRRRIIDAISVRNIELARFEADRENHRQVMPYVQALWEKRGLEAKHRGPRDAERMYHPKRRNRHRSNCVYR